MDLEYEEGGGKGAAILVGLLLAALVIGGLAYGVSQLAQGLGQDRQAQRLQAQAQLEAAQAGAYQVRVEANTEAAAERAATRQMERDAAQGRALTWLPFVALCLGAVLVGLAFVLAAWDLLGRRQAQPTGDAVILLAELHRLGELQAERDRAILVALGRRPALSDGRGEVILYGERRR